MKPFWTLKTMRLFFAAGLGWLFTYFSIYILHAYTSVLFILLPFVMAMTSTLIMGSSSASKRKYLRNTAYLTLLVYCVGIWLFNWDGIICILMVAPFAIPLTYLGFLAGFAFLNSKMQSSASMTLILLFMSIPALMAFENIETDQSVLRSVSTSIDIDAAANVVWKNITGFSPLAEPTELIFKTGIAYPISASITGTGVGAIRRCNFTTGCTVESISSWDENKLLAFDIQQQPDPIREFTIKQTHPEHMDGYWLSKKGEFRLIPLANGLTRLEGTTWYTNRIEPVAYWNIWGDYIVRAIQHRVLQHIKLQAEKK